MKKRKHGCMPTVIVGALCFGVFAMYQTADPGSAHNAGKRARMGPPVQLEFVAELDRWCAAYRGGRNEIRKSEIFRSARALTERQRLRSVRGRLSTISTNQGGGELSLAIDVNASGKSVRFRTGRAIKRGGKVYRAAAKLEEGACVIFSARRVRSASVLERGQVCDRSFVATVDALKGCGS